MRKRVSFGGIGVSLFGLVISCAGCAADTDSPRPPAESDSPAPATGVEVDRATARFAEMAAPHVERLLIDHRLTARGALRVVRGKRDELSMTHIRVQQTHGGLPVYGGEAIIHLGASGALSSITDAVVPDLDVDTTPLFDAEEAKERALAAVPHVEWLSSEPTVELGVLRHEGEDHLVYKVRAEIVALPYASIPVLYVDAHGGEVVHRSEEVSDATGSGQSNYSGYVNFPTWLQQDIGYRLYDIDRRFTTPREFVSEGMWVFASEADNTFTDPSEAAVVDIHYGASKTFDYFKNVFQRDGLNGAWGPADATSPFVTGAYVLPLISYRGSPGNPINVNAKWMPVIGDHKAYFGAGDGVTTRSVTSVDVVGHELTHGLVESEANLNGTAESQALNESLADVFGNLIEAYAYGRAPDWLIANGVFLDGSSLRNMANPAALGHPTRYEYYWKRDVFGNEFPHENAGIGNLAFYLTAVGGTNPTATVPPYPVSGVGTNVAANVWYRAITNYLLNGANYASFRLATIAAASDAYGATSAVTSSVIRAWDNVGAGITCGAYAISAHGTVNATTTSVTAVASFTAAAGTHYFLLTAPTTLTTKIILQRKQSNGTWAAEVSDAAAGTHGLSIGASAGTFRVLVNRTAGGGTFDLCNTHP